MMEQLKLTLSEQEQRSYGELFGMCDVEGTGIVSGGKAFDLFLSSGLSQDELHKITDLCGAKRLGHFGRSQFYIALKMIALAQQGIPVSNESLNSVGVELPLPLFGRVFNANQHANEQNYVFPERPVPGGVGGIPPPPKHPRGSIQGQRIPGYDSQEPPADTLSPQFSPNGSPPLSPGQTQGESQGTKPSAPPVGQFYHDQFDGHTHSTHPAHPPQAPPTQTQASQPPPTGWTHFHEDNQALLAGVQQQQEQQWANFSDHNKADNSSISSEAESVDDVWSITEEQHEYYVNQFMTMQPNMSGVIHGHVAKEFFEKSKLPVKELSKIWQLSDVDRDGSLSLDEFCTAMHLVVLRRNDIELPEELPPALIPYTPLGSTEEPFAADLPPGGTIRRMTPPSPTPPIQSNQWPHSAFTAPPPQPQPPQSPTSSLSSPGTKPEPVQFDIKPAISDPDSKIIHPVPMRLSPEGPPLPFTECRGYEALTDGSPNEPVMSPTKSRTPADMVDYSTDQHHPGPPLPMPLQSRPRPTPKKALSIPGPTVEPQTAPPGSRQALLRPPPGGQPSTDPSLDRPNTLPVTGGGEVAPPPPPRSTKTGHSRSSSLDNQLIDFSDDHQGGSSQLLPPPAVPPRPSPKDASNTASYSQSGVTLGTGEIRDIGACAMSTTDKEMLPAMGSSLNLLDSEDDTRDDTDLTTSAASVAQQMANKTKKEMKSTVRKHRERNNMLLRLNNELNQELQEVMEQRIALEIQLEHLRPFNT